MNIEDEDSPETIKAALEARTYIYLSKMISIFFETIRAIRFHIAINDLIDKDASNSSYLIQLSGVNYDMAVISWCKLFGAEGSQDTHYLHLINMPDLRLCLSKININNDDDLKNSLLNGIDSDVGTFDLYLTDSIVKYRDKFVAHYDLEMHVKYYEHSEESVPDDGRLKALPVFDIAIKSLFWLYSLIAKILRCKSNTDSGENWAIFTIDKIERRIAKEIAPLIKKLS